MAKLHELIAVEGDLEGSFKSILSETEKTFKNKENLFIGLAKTLTMFDEAEGLESPDEFQELSETVIGKLEYNSGHAKRYFDAVLQKELTNQTAKADIVIDGATIAKDLPATFLLGLETRLKHLRAAYASIPTLAPGKKWVPAPEKGTGVYAIENPEQRFKTTKTFMHKVLYEATEQHPAQIEKWEETKNVGKWEINIWSGQMTVAEKSETLGRFDKLLRAVKKARQRANCAEVVKRTIGDEIFGYLHADYYRGKV